MEGPTSSERAAVIRRDDDRGPVRDGIGVDGEGRHQRICEGERQCRSVGACMFFVQGAHLHIVLTIT